MLAMDIAALNKKGYLSDAFFDYDQSDLREDARSALAADAEWLKKYPTVQVLIEGHCRRARHRRLQPRARRPPRQRGQASTCRRSASTARGCARSPTAKERPFCTESTESCWQQNRRAHLVITAK